MNAKAILGRFEEDLVNSNAQVRSGRMAYARKFLDFAEGRPFTDWDARLVNDFIQYLKDDGYAEGTIRLWFSIVKRVFDAAKAAHEAERVQMIASVDPKDPTAVAQLLKAISLPAPNWNLGKRAAPKVSQQDTPTMSDADLKVMIYAAHHDGFKPHEKAYLALSSIYGLRRGELASVRAEHINYDQGTIWMDTEKGGDKRNQALCPEIVPVLREYDFSKEYSDFEMSRLWWVIEDKAGLEHRINRNWHSMRRYVVTALRDVWGEDSIQVKLFTRWKLASSPEISDRYYHKDPIESDRQVLARHPVVELWRGAVKMDL
jgi:integrase